MAAHTDFGQGCRQAVIVDCEIGDHFFHGSDIAYRLGDFGFFPVLDVIGNSNGGQGADQADYDHQLDKRESPLARAWGGTIAFIDDCHNYSVSLCRNARGSK
jgi:hypothetical protein